MEAEKFNEMVINSVWEGGGENLPSNEPVALINIEPFCIGVYLNGHMDAPWYLQKVITVAGEPTVMEECFETLADVLELLSDEEFNFLVGYHSFGPFLNVELSIDEDDGRKCTVGSRYMNFEIGCICDSPDSESLNIPLKTV